MHAPHIQRMLDEKAELADRWGKLCQFVDSNPVFQDLPALEKALMRKQLDAMGLYLGALSARIDRACPSEVDGPSHADAVRAAIGDLGKA